MDWKIQYCSDVNSHKKFVIDSTQMQLKAHKSIVVIAVEEIDKFLHCRNAYYLQ